MLCIQHKYIEMYILQEEAVVVVVAEVVFHNL